MRRISFILFFYCIIAMVKGQSPIDSLEREKLKEEIKAELRAEITSGKEITDENKTFSLKNFTLSGYGAVNYYSYNFDTDRSLKNKTDIERLNLYLGYKFNDRISLRSEIEYEHGGTGATLEYDVQEEGGEFEQEIEQGGEVKLEQLYIDFDINTWLKIRVGRMKVHFGLAQSLDRPTQYFTSYKPEMENEILPLGWYENGIQFYGTLFGKLNYELSLVNGLDSSGFSSRGWIKDGHQAKFEMINAESFAVAGRLDYKFGTHRNTYIGISGYVGDSAPNRPKKDMNKSAYVTIVEGHISYNENYLRFNTLFLYGNLENSDVVSKANSKLSKTLGVKRNGIGKNALGFSAEIGYDIFHLINKNTKQLLFPFARYDYYDTMYDVEGSVVKNSKWERSTITTGLNWFVHPQIVFKAHYSNRRLGSQNYDPVSFVYTGKKQKENTFGLGIGFSF
ncbi:MAG: OprO/OprP family phosphate-selective porin [Flavobacteriaceae bacterium]|nr:OprO/OprP family phosphate-selective porin [Flavobacteriaceae bacterium]